jgi:hypothetical protein
MSAHPLRATVALAAIVSFLTCAFALVGAPIIASVIQHIAVDAAQAQTAPTSAVYVANTVPTTLDKGVFAAKAAFVCLRGGPKEGSGFMTPDQYNSKIGNEHWHIVGTSVIVNDPSCAYGYMAIVERQYNR